MTELEWTTRTVEVTGLELPWERRDDGYCPVCNRLKDE